MAPQTAEKVEFMRTLTLQDIKELIPHRYPMLLIDRVILNDADSGVGIKAVSGNEPFFQGHFPSKPIMPGVLIVEAMAQTAGVIVMSKVSSQSQQNTLVYFMSIDNVKFRKPVTPGDLLELRVQKIQSRANVWKFSGHAYVGDYLHAEAEFTAMTVVEAR